MARINSPTISFLVVMSNMLLPRRVLGSNYPCRWIISRQIQVGGGLDPVSWFGGIHRSGNAVSRSLAFVQARSYHSTNRYESKRPLRAKSKKKKKNAEDEMFRADRVLSQRTDMSRSECFDLLKQKRIWQKSVDQINNDDDNNDDEIHWTFISGPSTKLRMSTPLWIDKTHPVPLPPPLMVAYHKPKWVLSVTKDPHLQRPCLDDKILPYGMHPVGRLDYDSSGLLLFSSSGPLTQRMLHPKHEISKVYEVVVTNQVDQTSLQNKLTEGVKTGEGVHTAELLSVEHFPDDAVAPYLEEVRSGIPSHYNQTDLEERGYLDIFRAEALSRVSVRVSEGKHRMVRRIMANCGHPVVSLIRRRFGEISLDDLPEGSRRALTDEEESWVQSLFLER